MVELHFPNKFYVRLNYGPHPTRPAGGQMPGGHQPRFRDMVCRDKELPELLHRADHGVRIGALRRMVVAVLAKATLHTILKLRQVARQAH